MATISRSSARITSASRSSSSRLARPVAARAVQRSRSNLRVQALFGGPPPGGDKKFIKREEEPDEYWSSKGEKAGSNPMKDPLAIIGVIAILFPFIFVLIAIGTGAIDTSVYRGS